METTNGDSFFVTIVVSICFLISLYPLNKYIEISEILYTKFIESKYHKKIHTIISLVIHQFILVVFMMGCGLILYFFIYFIPGTILKIF
jgi:hypothetical protein